MDNEEAWINNIKNETICKIKRKSAYSLPTRPSEEQIHADTIKSALYAFVTDNENSVISEINRIVKEINDTFDKRVQIAKIEQTEVAGDDNGTNVVEVTLTNGERRYFKIRNGSKGDKGDKGLKGDNAFIRYSANADGTDFTENLSDGQIYIGIATGQEAPKDKSEYKWCLLGVVTEKSKIYGVDGVGGEAPTLTRTDGAIGLTFTDNGDGTITSDFNTCYPWSDITEVTDDNGNVFMRIPKFYSKVTRNDDGTYKYQISGTRHSGFSTLFIDGKGNKIDYVLVGKYEGSGDVNHIYSKSGQAVTTSITIDDFRSGCKANGEGYQQYDLLIDTIIKQLFMIEFATTNSQSIMRGLVNNGNRYNTGHTDNVKTPSGSWSNVLSYGVNSPLSSNTAEWGKFPCKYRGIENLWGNTSTWCDGINFTGERIYICTDPTSYAQGKTDAPYSYVGDRYMVTNRCIMTIAQFETAPLLGFVANGSDVADLNKKYYADRYQIDTNNKHPLAVGGHHGYVDGAGLWATLAWGNSQNYVGGRLCYKPIA